MHFTVFSLKNDIDVPRPLDTNYYKHFLTWFLDG